MAIAMIRIVGRPGLTCSIWVDFGDSPTGSAVLRAHARSGAVSHMWTEHGPRGDFSWELVAGQTYTLDLVIGSQSGRVRIALRDRDSEIERLVEERVLRRGVHAWSILAIDSRPDEKTSLRAASKQNAKTKRRGKRGLRRRSASTSPATSSSRLPGKVAHPPGDLDSEEAPPGVTPDHGGGARAGVDLYKGPWTGNRASAGSLGLGDKTDIPPAAEASPAPESESVPRSRANVQTGFSSMQDPASAVDKNRPLRLGAAYYFWFHVGDEAIPGTIDREKTSLETEGIPEGARLDVVVFAFEREFGIEPGLDVGALELHGAEDARGERAVRVQRPVATPEGVDTDLLARRLFFPLRMPAEAGLHRLRCNVYFRQVLLQSRLVSVEVAADPEDCGRQVLETVLDYKISEQLRTELLASIDEHVLSVLLNDNGNGTHGFRFFGGDDTLRFKNEATILGNELTTKIQSGRRQLHRVSWGSPEKWDGDVRRYRYGSRRPDDDLRRDLVDLARTGFRMYDHIAARLARQAGKLDRQARWDLEDLMRAPGKVQIAAKQSASHVIPAALFYDYPFDDGEGDEGQFTLCPTFVDALGSGQPLLKSACFQGRCPTRKNEYVVCPSGFWGYRHEIGFPTTEQLDVAPSIRYDGQPHLLMAVSTDSAFTRREAHEKELQKLFGPSAWHYADDVDLAYEQMRQDRAQVVYFYCHGGRHTSDSSPYLEVGHKNNSKVITRGGLSNKRILWQDHPPLVFINGCHTTALDPEVASDLVSGFRECNAVGVVGTEITIFESLACSVAESFFRHLLAVDSGGVGDALRRARLDLLQCGNPLGLVYIPFVLASIKLKKLA